MQQLNSIQKSDSGSLQDTCKFGETGQLGLPQPKKEVWDNFSFASKESTIHEHHQTGTYQDSLFFSENVLKQRLGLVEDSACKADACLTYQSEKKPDPFNPTSQLCQSIVMEKEASPQPRPDKRLQSKQLLEEGWKKQRAKRTTQSSSNSGKKQSSKASVGGDSARSKASHQASHIPAPSKEAKKSAGSPQDPRTQPSEPGQRASHEVALENVRRSLASIRSPRDSSPSPKVPPLKVQASRDRGFEPSFSTQPRLQPELPHRQASSSPAFASGRVLRSQDLNVTGVGESRKLTNIYKELDRQKRATTESFKRLSEKYELMLKDYQPWDESRTKSHELEAFREAACIAERFREATDSSFA